MKPVADVLAEIERACQVLDSSGTFVVERQKAVSTIRANVRLLHDATKPETKTICGVPGRNGVCIKPPKHGQRHRYGKPSAPKPDNGWRDFDWVTVFGPTGVRSYKIGVGAPVKVKGWGRTINTATGEKAAQGGWWIVGIQKREDKINVEICQTFGARATRTVTPDKLVYVKPTQKKLSSRPIKR